MIKVIIFRQAMITSLPCSAFQVAFAAFTSGFKSHFSPGPILGYGGPDRIRPTNMHYRIQSCEYPPSLGLYTATRSHNLPVRLKIAV
jgi:hypothetical protein